MRRRRTGSHANLGTLVVGASIALGTLSQAQGALAQSRGPVVVMALRSPDGDDEAAGNMTAALRQAATEFGYTVPSGDPPVLDQEMALFGCSNDLPPSCLTQI